MLAMDTKLKDKPNLKHMFAVGQIMGKETESSPFVSAQVALINDKDWCVIGVNKRWSGMIENLSLSELTCPIVITTGIIAKNTLDLMIRSYVTIEGIHDLDMFLHQMEQIGGNVIYPGEDL